MPTNNREKDRPTPVRETYTPEELARILGISRNGVYRGLRDGTIPHVRIGNRYVIPKMSVGSWLADIGRQIRERS
jgi:excisionase family DNA binding protein